MKKFILLVLLIVSVHAFSQENYTINGETLELKTEVDGALDLLWNSIDGQYRYFVKTEDGKISELKNTKNANNKYQEEYKITLASLTNGAPTNDVKLTLYSLRNYIDNYNTSADSTYVSSITKSKVYFRLGFSAGVTNNPFVSNPDNVKAPLIGAELEIYEINNLARHSGFLQARHAFETDAFSYSATELSLGYRYRVVNTPKFSIYGQVKLATVNFVNITFIDANSMEASANDTSFDLPLTLGLGADYKICEKGYITFIISELYSVTFDNQGNYPIDFSLGFKFDL